MLDGKRVVKQDIKDCAVRRKVMLYATIIRKNRKYRGRIITCFGKIRIGSMATIGYFENGRPMVVSGVIQKIS